MLKNTIEHNQAVTEVTLLEYNEHLLRDAPLAAMQML